MKLKLTIYIALFTISLTRAQDIHFSHLHASPFALNPAMTGVFEGDIRLIANFRNQWKSVTADYRTVMFSGDTNILELGRNVTLGMGGHFFSDIAGDLDFSTNFSALDLSIFRSFNRDQSHVLSLGVQIGHMGSNFDPSKIIAFEDEITLLEDGRNRTSLFDVSAGLLWYKKILDGQFLYLGGAMFHANQPIFSFFDNKDLDNRLYPRFVFHGGGNIDLNDFLTLMPNFIFMKQGPHAELTFGSFFRYDHDPKKNRTPAAFLAGAWLRGLSNVDNIGFDALVSAFRIDYGSFTFSFSYDINISSLARASFGRGGPEVSVIYIFGKPDVRTKRVPGDRPWKKKHKIKCPYF